MQLEAINLWAGKHCAYYLEAVQLQSMIRETVEKKTHLDAIYNFLVIKIDRF